MPYKNAADKAANAARYAKTPEGKAAQVRRSRKYLSSPKGRAAQGANTRRMRERYPLKVKARDLLNYAVRRGLVVKTPCEVCGRVKVEAHHADYSRPLSVHWLCKRHHDEVKESAAKAQADAAALKAAKDCSCGCAYLDHRNGCPWSDM